MANIERLTRLRDFMLTVPDERFSMNWFFGGADAFPGESASEYLGRCGTAACLAGWACAIPEFRSLGLGISHEYFHLYPFYLYPSFKEGIGFTAMEEFFDLTYDESKYLFAEDGPSRAAVPKRRSEWSPRDGAAHLSQFIEEVKVAGITATEED